MRGFYLIRYYISIIIFFLTISSANAQEKSSIKFPDCNIILIVVDCLRADHLSCYGYFRKTSPNIDSLAQEGILFEQAITQANKSLLSFASIFTSQYVSTHGVNETDRCLGDSALTLAEVLKIYNYRTAAFVGGRLLNPVYRLNQGFDTYFCVDKTAHSFNEVIPEALKWLKERKEKKDKFFLLLHGNDLHTPYSFPVKFVYDKGYRGRLSDPTLVKYFSLIYKKKIWEENKKPIPLSDRDINYIIALYDEGINYADELIGNFLNYLSELKLLDKTIIVLTADHGEELFDHDWFFHVYNLYEGTIRVPLIIRIPSLKLEKKKIAHQVQLIDLMPTILELIGIEPNMQAEGHSLLSLIIGKITPGFNQYVFSEASFGVVAIRADKWKLIYYLNDPDKTELFNLKVDPKEKNNLIKKRPEIALQFIKELFGWLRRREDYDFSQEVSAENETVKYLKERKRMINEFYEYREKIKHSEDPNNK